MAQRTVNSARGSRPRPAVISSAPGKKRHPLLQDWVSVVYTDGGGAPLKFTTLVRRGKYLLQLLNVHLDRDLLPHSKDT